MPVPAPSPEKSVKLAVTLTAPVAQALAVAAAAEGLEPYEVIQRLVADYVMECGTLDDETRGQILAGRRVVAAAVEVAVRRCREGAFSRDITLETFQECVKDPAWLADYRIVVQDDVYKHGNPRKSINREIGFRIRAAIGGVVEKTADGKPALEKVLGEVIQSYTPMVDFDRSLMQRELPIRKHPSMG